MFLATGPGRARSKPSLRPVGLAALVALALAAAACGSSSPSTTTTAASGTSTAPTTTASTSAASAGQTLAKIASKLEAGQMADFAATYNLSGVTGTKSVQATMTMAHEGSDELLGVTAATGTFDEITKGKTVIWCAKEAASGSWSCYEGSFGTEVGAALKDLFDVYGSSAALSDLQANEGAAAGVSESSSTVAGTPVNCVSYHSSAKHASFTYCATASGVLAEWHGSDSEGHWQLNATAYSSSVPAGEFTPPATPTTIPS